MKTLIVDLGVSIDYDGIENLHRTYQTANVEIEDDIAATLQTMLDNTKPDGNGEVYLLDDDLRLAFNDHPELKQLYSELLHRCDLMSMTCLCDNADEDIAYQNLCESFYDDVKDGLYEPVDDDDFDPEVDGYNSGSAQACYNNYKAWVLSHADDPYFMADRLGIDVGACDSEYSFRIKEIK